MEAAIKDANERKQQRAELSAAMILLREDQIIGRYRVRNVCAGGALIEGGRPTLSVGDKLRAVLLLPNNDPVALDARVIRQQPLPDGDTGSALCFINVPEWARSLIDLLVFELLADEEEHDLTTVRAERLPIPYKALGD